MSTTTSSSVSVRREAVWPIAGLTTKPPLIRRSSTPMTSIPDRNSIRLSLNENPFGPSPRTVDAIRADLVGLSSYTGDALAELVSLVSLREGIASEHIVLGEILHTFGPYLSANGGWGGEFIYTVPGYTALVDAVAPAGGVAVGVPLNERLENDLRAIADRVNARTRAVYLVNPHNTSGTVSEAARTAAGLVRKGAKVLCFERS